MTQHDIILERMVIIAPAESGFSNAPRRKARTVQVIGMSWLAGDPAQDLVRPGL